MKKAIKFEVMENTWTDLELPFLRAREISPLCFAKENDFESVSSTDDSFTHTVSPGLDRTGLHKLYGPV